MNTLPDHFSLGEKAPNYPIMGALVFSRTTMKVMAKRNIITD
jgi:hypothetical protein